MAFRVYFTLVLIALAVDTHAQFELMQRIIANDKEASVKKTTTGSSKKPSKPAKEKTVNEYNKNTLSRQSPIASNQPDSAFYMNVVRRNGWFEGIGSQITPELASHQYCYYKLSNKNAAGHWTLMQAFDGLGRLTVGHSISNYLINIYDNNDGSVNPVWKEKLGEVCQWTSITSYDGKKCIQEQGLDADGNVVYSMIITQTGPRNFFCTYLDTWGKPASFRTDSKGNDLGDANLVEIVRDSAGYEVMLRYYNRNGFPVKNRNGSYMLAKTYDRHGNATRAIALDLLGEPMIDDWAYSGNEYTYDKYGNKLTSFNLGIDGSPCPSKEGLYGSWNEYDSYGRLVERGALDVNRSKCTDEEGVFRHVFAYDDCGRVVSYTRYDKDGQEITDDDLSTTSAEVDQEYDDAVLVDTLAYGDHPDDAQTTAESASPTQAEHSGRVQPEERDSTIVDPLGHSVTTYKLRGDEFVRGYVVKRINDRNPGDLIMYNITSYGEHARTGNAYYYMALLCNDIYGNEIMMGVNEFGEPAYITMRDSKSVAFLYTYKRDGKSFDFDEYGSEQTGAGLDSLSLNLPKVFCVEVTDTATAYPIGIRNNDIILSYGNWRIAHDVRSGTDRLPSEMEERLADRKVMTVLRHHPEQKRSEILSLHLNKGLPHQLGFTTHLIYYTQREKKRLCDAAEAAAFEFSGE